MRALETMVASFLRAPLVAVAFLTRLPVPGAALHGSADIGLAAVFFPLVGAGLGALAGTLADLPHPRLAPSIVAVLVVATLALVTGALHLDGLADTADGMGGGRTRADCLRIMKDHAIGSYGAVAITLLLALKIVTLAALISAHTALRALVVGGTLSRWTTLPLAAFLPCARPESGLGRVFAQHLRPRQVIAASVLTAAVVWLAAGWRGGLWWVAVAALTLLAGLWFRRRLGGVTGDTLGAVVEICEVLVWLLVLLLPI